MGEESVGVNLVAEEEWESEEDEDEEWWVNTVRAVEEADEPRSEGKTLFTTSDFMRRDNPKLEDELEYSWEAHNPSSPRESKEDRWWSPEPPQPSSEEDEEEVQYLVQVPGLEPQGREAGAPMEINPNPKGIVVSPRDNVVTSSTPHKGKPCHHEHAKRRKLRKKMRRTEDQKWKQARQDAWLREMLTDTSESENEERCERFAESRRWITELFGIPQYPRTTSGGECSGQKMPDGS
jgi:hypothetical protein